ncbi:MAG: DsbA family oxidoreductase [Alphaproteobacteria bacterium]
MPTQETPLQVDIVSDVVCPWCVIGYRQLDVAARNTGTELSVTWHPFELNPYMAEEGENLREHLAAKYGTTSEQSVKARERLTTMGTELGFTFNYADDMRMHNTFRAHQLMQWAAEQGRKHDLKLALFAAFFTERANINDLDVLARVAGDIGLDRDAAFNALECGDYADPVREAERFWTSRGIDGVPAMIFDGKYLLVGAQGIPNYEAVLQQLTDGKAA